MDQKNLEQSEWDDFVRLIRQRYRLILMFVLTTCLVTVIVTFFIPKEYTSSAVIFPTDTNSLDDVLKNPQFGYDVEADRLLQILQSRGVRDSIIRKFNLVSYYDIDMKDLDWAYQVTKEYGKDVTFSRTPYMSIVISARTRDPEMSARIVNEIIRIAGKSRENLLKQNVFLALQSLQDESVSLKKDLDSLGGVVNSLTASRKNITQYVQTERYISLIFDKSQMSDDASAKSLQLVINQYNVKLSWYYEVMNKLKAATMITQRPLPAMYVIENATPSYKKSYPKFSTNLLIAFFSSMVFSTVFLYFIQKTRRFSIILQPA